MVDNEAPRELDWIKSSRSYGYGECVELAADGEMVALRASKDPAVRLHFTRAELAAFVDRTLQASNGLDLIEGRTVEAGIGVDRKAGNYRVSGTLIFTEQPDRNDITLVTLIDRSFARETRSLRAFAVYNPRAGSAFARVIASLSLRDNVSLEGSGGWFTGGGLPRAQSRVVDILARFADRDFLYARLKVFF